MEKENEILKSLLENKRIRDFVLENNLSKEYLLTQIPFLMLFNSEIKKCDECMGKTKCKQDETNLIPTLKLYNKKIDMKYKKCPYKTILDDNYCEFLYVEDPERLINMDLYFTDSRVEIFNYINEYMEAYKNKVYKKGLYIHGKFGVGKTFILLQVARLFSDLKKKVIFTYYPDFVRKVKSSIGTYELEDIVRRLKYCSVLFLDDFGAEVNSSFVRDEVLGPILQYRSQNNLPVFISSNLDIQSLYNHFSETRTDINNINASRIIERIRLLCKDVELNDKNYRK